MTWTDPLGFLRNIFSHESDATAPQERPANRATHRHREPPSPLGVFEEIVSARPPLRTRRNLLAWGAGGVAAVGATAGIIDIVKLYEFGGEITDALDINAVDALAARLHESIAGDALVEGRLITVEAPIPLDRKNRSDYDSAIATYLEEARGFVDAALPPLGTSARNFANDRTVNDKGQTPVQRLTQVLGVYAFVVRTGKVRESSALHNARVTRNADELALAKCELRERELQEKFAQDISSPEERQNYSATLHSAPSIGALREKVAFAKVALNEAEQMKFVPERPEDERGPR